MSVMVYVINQNGHPLMPCHPSKARKLLRDKRARVASRRPFTLQLLWDCEEQVQEVVAGIDKGDVVRVKRRYIKQINSIYSTGYLAFKRIKGEPAAAQPKDCQLLKRACTIVWEKVG